MSKIRGVALKLHENIAESGKSIADEVIELFEVFLKIFFLFHKITSEIFLFSPTSLNTFCFGSLLKCVVLWVGELVHSIRIFIIVLCLRKVNDEKLKKKNSAKLKLPKKCFGEYTI